MIARYDYKPISHIWSESNRYQLWTLIELTFLKHFKGINVEVPEMFHPDWIEKIQHKEKVTKHDVAAFVEWLEQDYLYPRIRENSRFVHYGLTSSDILDTAFSMQIRDSNNVIIELVTDVTDMLFHMGTEYRDVKILGRTHGQAAEIRELSEKFFSYEAALQTFYPGGRLYYGRLRGSVGDNKYITRELEEEVLTDLDLLPSFVNDGQIIHRAQFAQYMNDWAMLASVIEKIATDIRLLAQTEIGEIQEGFTRGQMGSSSMPHKKNPIASENLCGLARTIRGYQTTAMQNIALWNERDISHSSAERMIFPDAVILLGFMLHRLKDILQFIVVNESRMQHNIEMHWELLDTQQEMLTLIDNGASRKEAHAIMRNKRHVENS